MHIEIRDSRIDLIKSVAIIGVLVIHSCSGAYSSGINSLNFNSALFWGTIFRASVPLFFMCSGALLLDPQYQFTIKKLWTRNIPRLLIALFFWSAIYKLFHIIQSHTFSVYSLVQAAKELLLFKHETQMYFLHITLLIYILLPVTRLFVKYAEKQEVIYFLAAWAALAVIWPFLLQYPPFSSISGIPVQWSINLTWCAVGYSVLGWTLKKHKFKRPALFTFVFISGFVCAFLGTLSISVKNNALYEGFFNGNNPAVALMAVGAFGFVYSLEPPSGAITKILNTISRSSFCVFLVHLFFVYIGRAIGINSASFISLAAIPILALAELICSIAVWTVLSKIPWVRRWLI